MTKNTNKYKVEAYKSPYTDELFALFDEVEFQKHLRAHAYDLKRQAKFTRIESKRKDIWLDIRTHAYSIEDVFKRINDFDSDFLKNYKDSCDTKTQPLFLTLTDTTRQNIKNYGITHEAPLGHATNWGSQNEKLPGAKIALEVKIERSGLHHSIYAHASHESGIYAPQAALVLFADDWPFVAVQTLWLTLTKTMSIPAKYVYSEQDSTLKDPTNVINKDWDVFWKDIERYSNTYIGMPFSTLKGMYELGAVVNLDSLMQIALKNQPIVGPSDISLDELGLD